MRQLKITKAITNRESQSLEKYLQEIGKIDLITPEEEVQLALRIKQGDQVALEKLTKANLRFVVSVAKQYQNQWLSLSDLINEWNLGLIKAAQRFDETKGFKFISYAVWRIRQSILQALAENSRVVRLPLNKVWMSNKISKAYSKLEQDFEREPSSEEIAEMLEREVEEVENTLWIGGKHASLDAPFAGSEGEDALTLLDCLTWSTSDSLLEALDQEDLRTHIRCALAKLTKKEAQIVSLYFGFEGEPMSLQTIGESLTPPLTRERVRQIKDRAVWRLKRILPDVIKWNHLSKDYVSQNTRTTPRQREEMKGKQEELTETLNASAHSVWQELPLGLRWLPKDVQITWIIQHSPLDPHHQEMALHYFVRKNYNLNITKPGNESLNDHFVREAKLKRQPKIEKVLGKKIDFIGN